jgi:hypothetical protein
VRLYFGRLRRRLAEPVDALVWAITELAIAPMKGFGIFELYRQMAEEQTTRETARISAPDPRLRRENAILTERQRFADIVADRLPTAEEAAVHVAEIDRIITGRPY